MRGAADVRASQPTLHRIGPVRETVQKVDPARDRAVAQNEEGSLAEIAFHTGRDHADVAVSFAQVPPEAQRRDVRQRIDRHLGHRRARSLGDAGVFALRGGVHEGDDPPRVRAAGNLGRPENGRLSRLIDERPSASAAGPERRTLPDAPGIEEAQSFESAESEQPRALDEEGAPLLEEGLEGGQVHHRRVRLHLTEVRVDRGVQRETAGEPVLQVQSHRAPVHRAVVERARRVRALVEARARHRVRKDLQALGPPHPLQPQQVSERRSQAALGGRSPCPVNRFSRVQDVAAEVDPPDLAFALAEAELRKRYAHLGHPARRIDQGRGVPDGIPSRVHPLESVVGRDQVVAPPCRGHPEDEGCAVIVVRVELDQKQVVRLHEGIASSPQQRDPRRIAVVHARADIQRIVGVGHAHLGPLGCGKSVARPVTPKPGHRNRPLPDGFVEDAVEHGRRIRPHGRDRRRNDAVPVGQRRIGGHADLRRGLHADRGGEQ